MVGGGEGGVHEIILVQCKLNEGYWIANIGKQYPLSID